MSNVTVVCCWTNEKMYGDFLNTLKAQNIPCEIIGIDNRDNKSFTSCAAAYNSVIDDIKTKYVIYSHQDILLNDCDVLGKFVSYLERTTENDICGVAGVKADCIGTFTNIKHKSNVTGEILFAGMHRIEGGMMECDTVDECFFGGHTSHFRNYPFDEKICGGWHLYAAEACLHTKSDNVKRGSVKVCDADIIHMSSGNTDSKFAVTFMRLCRKYSKFFPSIRTTCGYSKTGRLDLCLYMLGFLYRQAHSSAKLFLKSAGLYDPLKKLIGK